MRNEKQVESEKNILINTPQLIEIKERKKVIFVGDTHGDLEVSQKAIKNYFKPGNVLVFLGDYVDRGPNSKKNLDFLLKTKIGNPEKIYLLQGNHEGHHILKFSPADFWESLNKNDYQKYCTIIEKFPLAIVTDDIIALHGVPPDIKNLEDVNKIKLGNKEWMQICWGDFVEEPREYLGIDPFSGRPHFGRDYFLKLMERFNKKVLIRSHQPDCPQFMFDNRCLTIFTSSAYAREKTIAIFDPKKKINTARNLEIKAI